VITPAQERFNRVFERIQKAAQRVGRNPQEITLVAVTKSVPLDQVLPFLQAGVCEIGENRVQEALAKYGQPTGIKRNDLPTLRLHMVGHLQRNKVKKAVPLFDMVQSLDSVELAEDLDRQARALQKVLPCLVEVKVSPEPTKTGLPPDQLEDFLLRAERWTWLRIQGLMGIPPAGLSAEESRPFFAKLRQLFEKVRLEILSMGMSADFEVAIEEGATMVRLGTALFGSRPPLIPSPLAGEG
jgi:hypothetical protein